MYELLSVFLVPLFLYTRLTDSTLAFVDFFREYTVKIDSIGHICSYAVFDFDRHGDAKVRYLSIDFFAVWISIKSN